MLKTHINADNALGIGHKYVSFWHFVLELRRGGFSVVRAVAWAVELPIDMLLHIPIGMLQHCLTVAAEHLGAF